MEDQIQSKVLRILQLITGTPGDLSVIFLFGLILYILFKKKYKMAAGFFVLTLGIVIIRVLISALF